MAEGADGAPRPAVPDTVAVGVFEGRTPCGPVANDFTRFPSENCEKIKWEITLYRERSSQAPAGYVYRGTRSSRRGAWSVSRGAGHDVDAVVYELHYGSNQTLSLLPVGENVLLVLARDRTVLVGDASWSYTLSRTDM
jgi:hypothetical protein